MTQPNNKRALTPHANLVEDADIGTATGHIKSVWLDRFGIDHSTIQVERGVCADN